MKVPFSTIDWSEPKVHLKGVMPKWVRLSAIAASLLGWLVASGLAWDGLQLAAWTHMAWKNSDRMNAQAAWREAVTGAPCEHCITVREGRKQSQEQAPVGSEKRLVADLELPTFSLPRWILPRETFARPVNATATRRTKEVDVPPPRLV